MERPPTWWHVLQLDDSFHWRIPIFKRHQNRCFFFAFVLFLHHNKIQRYLSWGNIKHTSFWCWLKRSTMDRQISFIDILSQERRDDCIQRGPQVEQAAIPGQSVEELLLEVPEDEPDQTGLWILEETSGLCNQDSWTYRIQCSASNRWCFWFIGWGWVRAAVSHIFTKVYKKVFDSEDI